MMSNIFLASLLLLHALCSSLPNARPTLSQDTPTTVLFGPALTSFDLPSNDAWNGAALVGPALASSSNPDWPEASCGPNDAYGYLAGVRRCADFLIKEVPSHQCNSVDHLDGWGALHCANRGGDGSLTAAVQSWSRTNVSQVNTCAEVGQAVIWVLDNCSRNDRRDTAGWKRVPGNDYHIVGVTSWR